MVGFKKGIQIDRNLISKYLGISYAKAKSPPLLIECRRMNEQK